MIWPATIEASTSETSIGVSNAPELDALPPSTICWNSGRNMIDPNMPTPDRNSTIMLAEKLRSLKNVRLRIGSCARRSMTTNATSATTASASSDTMSGDSHP